MAHYLVKAKPREDRLEELYAEVQSGSYRRLRPFGNELTEALLRARYDPEHSLALWEEEDYCTPPLAQERKAVLDDYFDGIKVNVVRAEEGWNTIDHHPSLWKATGVV